MGDDKSDIFRMLNGTMTVREAAGAMEHAKAEAHAAGVGAARERILAIIKRCEAYYERGATHAEGQDVRQRCDAKAEVLCEIRKAIEAGEVA